MVVRRRFGWPQGAVGWSVWMGRQQPRQTAVGKWAMRRGPAGCAGEGAAQHSQQHGESGKAAEERTNWSTIGRMGRGDTAGTREGGDWRLEEECCWLAEWVIGALPAVAELSSTRPAAVYDDGPKRLFYGLIGSWHTKTMDGAGNERRVAFLPSRSDE